MRPSSFLAFLCCSVLLVPPCLAASITTGDGLALELDQAGQVSGVSCSGAALPVSGTGGFSVCDFADQPGPENLVKNPGFESGQEGWQLAAGQSLDTTIAHSGTTSARLEVPGPQPGKSNLETRVPVRPLTAYRAGLWVRRQNVGVCGAYISERDGNNKLVGAQTQVGAAIPKVDGEWHPLRWEFTTGPQTTVLSLRGDIYNSTGTLWLDDFSLVEANEGIYRPVTGALESTADGLRFEGGLADGGLQVLATLKGDGSCIRIDGEVRDTTGRDRAIGLRFALPVDLTGWTWYDDAEEAREIAGGPAYRRTYVCRSGIGQCSVYPWSATVGKQAGLSLALPLSQGPRSFILQYEPGAAQYSATSFFGLAPDCGTHPSSAPFSLVLYRHDPAWGMRSAMENYYRLFPESFVKRPTFEGYLNYANLEQFDAKTHELVISYTSRLADASDFGESYHFLSHMHGCYDYRQVAYQDPTRPSDETVFALLRDMAKAEEGKGRDYVPTAETIKKIVYGSTGQIAYIGDTRYWRAHEGYNHTDEPGWGFNFRVNEDPGISDYLARDFTKRAQDWAAQPEYTPWGATFTADAIEGYMANSAELDYRREHFETTLQPLSFGRESLAPALINTIWDFHHKCWWPLTGEHKIATYGNANCYEQFFTMPYVDVPMTEFDWDPQHPGRLDRYMRATAYQKIWRHWHAWGKTGGYGDEDPDNVGRHLARSLACAVYPAVYCIQVTAQNLDDYRGLYRQYVPAIEELSIAGWEPVPYARADNDIVVERFGSYAQGELHFTLRNYTDEPKTATLSLETEALGIPAGTELLCRDILPGTPVFSPVTDGRIQLEIAPQGARALWVGTRQQAGRLGLRLAGRTLDTVKRLFSSELGKEAGVSLTAAKVTTDRAQAAPVDELPRLAESLQEDLSVLRELATTQSPVDLDKLLLRARAQASQAPVALLGMTMAATRLFEGCARGEATALEATLRGAAGDPAPAVKVLSPWENPAAASRAEATPGEEPGLCVVRAELFVPAEPPRGLLPYALAIKGQSGGEPFTIILPVDLAVGRPLEATATPARLFRGASRDVVMQVHNSLATAGEVKVKLVLPKLITADPAEFSLSLPAKGSAEQRISLQLDTAVAIGQHRLPYEVSSADARFNTSGTLPFTVGDPVPEVTLRKLQAAPTVDGKLDDAAWQGEPLIPGLRRLSGGGEASQKTTVWAGHDGVGLYIAFDCRESQMDKLVAKYTDRGSPLYLEDDVEVFISPAGASRAYQFAVNPLGTQSDNFGNSADWKAAAQRDDTGWSVEMYIPFGALGDDGKPRDLPWGMQFGRQEKPSGEVTSWTPGSAFIVRESMGEVKLE